MIHKGHIIEAMNGYDEAGTEALVAVGRACADRLAAGEADSQQIRQPWPFCFVGSYVAGYQTAKFKGIKAQN